MNEQEAVQKLVEQAQVPEQKEEVVETPETSGEEVQEFGETLEAPSEETETVDESQEVEATDEVQESEAEAEPSEAETYDLGADDFAELLGIKGDKLDITDDGKVKFKVKVGDEVSDVTLEDLINAHQGSANLTNRSKALAESEKAISAKLNDLNQHTTDFAQQAASILEEMKDTFTKPWSQEDMRALREDDPAEFAARMEEIRQREAQFNEIAKKAVNLVSEPQGLVNQETQAQYQQFLQTEQQKIQEAIPNYKQVEPELIDFAKNVMGYDDSEIGYMADSRLIRMMHMAWQFNNGKQQVKQQLKRKIPKITKPGKTQTKQSASLEKQQKLRQQVKKSGDPNDAVALIRSMMRK
jgi:hypothetical protein